MIQAVVEMVQRAMAYIDKAPDVETQIELIKTLNTVTAGKVSVVQLSTQLRIVVCGRLRTFPSSKTGAQKPFQPDEEAILLKQWLWKETLGAQTLGFECWLES